MAPRRLVTTRKIFSKAVFVREFVQHSYFTGSSPNRVGKKVKLMARKTALDEQ
jgi:hypothetical protein